MFAGLLVPKMSASEVLKVYDTRIKAKIVNFKTGELTDSKGDFDLNSELRSDETSLSHPITLKKILQKNSSSRQYRRSLLCSWMIKVKPKKW